MPKLPPEPTPTASKDSSSSDAIKISRRTFGRNAAAIGALSLSPASLLAVVHEPRVENAAGTGVQGQTNADGNAKLGITPEQAAEVDAKLANILRKFGSRLSDEQRAHLRRILAYNERMLAGVRSFSVQNGDPPASVLRVFPMKENVIGGARRGGAPTKPANADKKQEGVH